MSDDYSNLISKWLAGDATPAETERLLSICKASPERLAECAELASVERLLPLLEEPPEYFTNELRDRLSTVADRQQFAGRVQRRIKAEHRRLLVPLAIFLGVAALALLFLLPPATPDSAETVTTIPSPSPLASVSSSVAAAWEQDFAPTAGVVHVGRYRLTRGLVSLEFGSGVSLIIEGPAEFEVTSAEHVVLQDGTITAKVPDGAEGFTVDTSSTRVIDRGTEFAVSASRTGDTEVHVLDGIVDAHPLFRPNHRIRLLEDQARIFNQEGDTAAVADPGRFYREMPASSTDLRWLHWPLDEGVGDETIGSNHGLAGGEVPTRLNAVGKASDGPQWVSGVIGHAIQFDGKDDYLQTDYEGIGGTHARTVALWVKVPADSTERQGYGMISWGSYEFEGATWQFSINPTAEDGPLGRLRVGINRGQVIGQTDLRDGRWHHVAAVMYGGEDANTATHVILFVDGEYEAASRKSLLAINTDVDSRTARKVQMGRNAALTDNYRSCFRGAIDEIYLFDAALDQEEIRRLMNNQTPR